MYSNMPLINVEEKSDDIENAQCLLSSFQVDQTIESDVHFEAIYEEQNRVYDEVSSCGEAFNSYKEAFVLSKPPTFMKLLKASDEKPLDITKNCC